MRAGSFSGLRNLLIIRIAGRLVLALSMVALAIPAVAQDDLIPRMERVIRLHETEKTFMGAVLVAKGDKVLIDEGYGYADLEWNVANTPAAKFRIGSVTKQFTAAAILLLDERGKLKIDEPVKDHLPDTPTAWDKITIYELLTHTSGIPNFTEFPEVIRALAKESTPAELVASFRDKPLEFEPGTQFHYSNSGYVLLGYLIEKISGQSYGQFLQQNIFAPLGMKNTGVDDNSTVLPGRAQGYAYSHAEMKHPSYLSMSIVFSAGDLYSTTGDLLKWERGLFGGKVLTASSLTKMTSRSSVTMAAGLR
jgi:CubicO group peptidase (beta-lactamase class C family)